MPHSHVLHLTMHVVLGRYWFNRIWLLARIDRHIQRQIVVITLSVPVTMYAREQDNHAKMDPPSTN
jgi:hypothetical protein